MYCPRCGSQSEESAAFCAKCGTGLANESPAVSRPVYGPGQGFAPGGLPAQQTQYYPAYQNPYQPGFAMAPVAVIPHVNNHLAFAIVSIFLFWPTAIPAVVYASKVDNRIVMGDIAGAQRASSTALVWSWVSLGLFLASIVVPLIVFFAVVESVATSPSWQ